MAKSAFCYAAVVLTFGAFLLGKLRLVLVTDAAQRVTAA